MFPFIVTLLTFLLASTCHADEEDRVLRLPGQKSDIPFKTYSGYLNGSEGTFLHYVFTESQGNPAKDPLLIWLNGGPGCSSMLGFFTEQGPFRVQKGGQRLENNPWAWNKLANIFFLESPAGVGYSYSVSQNYTIDDDGASLNNLLAIKSFFRKFPRFRNHDFYLSGESYAGVYIPTLSVRLLGEPSIKYKGFAIGNGYLDQEKLGNSKVFFAYYHGLIDRSTWSNLVSNCCENAVSEDSCEFVNNANVACNKLVTMITDRISNFGLNPYNIYDRCETSADLRLKYPINRQKVAWTVVKNLAKPVKSLKTSNHDEASSSPPCINDDDLEAYLNRRDVRQALNIPDFLPQWTDCSNDVSNNYINIYKSLKDQVVRSIKAGKRGLIYNGDVDLVCDFLGDQWFAEDLGFPAITEYLPWHVNNQTAGFVKHFQGFTMATIRGSGHMVPTDRPTAAFEMLKLFLNGRKFE